MIDIMACCPLDTSALPQGLELEQMLDTIRSTPGYGTARCDNCLQLCHIGPRQQVVLDAVRAMSAPMLVLCFACAWDVTDGTERQVTELTSGTSEQYERGQS